MLRSSRILWLVLLTQVCCICPVVADGGSSAAAPAAAARPQWVHPNAGWQTVGPPEGALLIAGGANNDTVYKAFLELVGDPDALIVFISTANDTLDERNKAYTELKKNGARNIVLLHTHDPREADAEAFVEPLHRAKAVYISGGHQKRLAQSYLHTRLHAELFRLLERGGVIGGSSAGASIQGAYLVGGGSSHREGLGLVKDSAIGQHYFRRKRMGSVGRIVRDNPGLSGVAIDEATAVIVRGNVFEVVGDSKVGVYNPQAADWSPAQPQTILFAGDRYDLALHAVTHRATPVPADTWADAGTPWVSPAQTWQAKAAGNGQLMLFGDKADSNAFADFIAAAGGSEAPIVVLSTGNSDLANNRTIAAALQAQGARSVQLLHTISRAEANSPSFSQVLDGAAAVWVCDGPLWRYAESYGQTLVHRKLFDLLERGGVVAASGAGAGVLAEHLFDAGYKWAEGYELLRDAMVLPEPLTAKNLKRVGSLMKKNKALVAIGLGEGASLLASGNRLKAGGRGEVKIYQMLDEEGLPQARLLASGEVFDFDVDAASASSNE